jgi:hypothetical protein
MIFLKRLTTLMINTMPLKMCVCVCVAKSSSSSSFHIMARLHEVTEEMVTTKNEDFFSKKNSISLLHKLRVEKKRGKN